MTYPPISMCHVVGCTEPATEITWCEQFLVGVQLCAEHAVVGENDSIQLDIVQVRADHAATLEQMQWSRKQ